MGKKDGNTVSQVIKLAQPIVDELGLYLWDVRFEKEGADWYLKVLIDSNEGITLEDCEAVSRPLSKRLDETDPIEQSYYLEVSSPGTERELKKPDHFMVCIGDAVNVKLFRPQDGKKEYRGILTDYQDGNFTVEVAGQPITFVDSDCAWVKLVDEFDVETI